MEPLPDNVNAARLAVARRQDASREEQWGYNQTEQDAENQEIAAEEADAQDEASEDIKLETRNNTSSRIYALEAFILFFAALVIDGSQTMIGLTFTGTGVLTGAGVVLNLFVDIVAYGLFWVWFVLRGMSLPSKGRTRVLGGSVITIIFEAIPFFNWLPAWSSYILFVIVQNRISAKVSDLKKITLK